MGDVEAIDINDYKDAMLANLYTQVETLRHQLDEKNVVIQRLVEKKKIQDKQLGKSKILTEIVGSGAIPSNNDRENGERTKKCSSTCSNTDDERSDVSSSSSGIERDKKSSFTSISSDDQHTDSESDRGKISSIASSYTDDERIDVLTGTKQGKKISSVSDISMLSRDVRDSLFSDSDCLSRKLKNRTD